MNKERLILVRDRVAYEVLQGAVGLTAGTTSCSCTSPSVGVTNPPRSKEKTFKTVALTFSRIGQLNGTHSRFIALLWPNCITFASLDRSSVFSSTSLSLLPRSQTACFALNISLSPLILLPCTTVVCNIVRSILKQGWHYLCWNEQNVFVLEHILLNSAVFLCVFCYRKLLDGVALRDAGKRGGGLALAEQLVPAHNSPVLIAN